MSQKGQKGTITHPFFEKFFKKTYIRSFQ